MHERLILRFGGAGGVRDYGLLESALYRPQTGYYADLVEMAAAMFESLLMNHPFIDGNKRTAFACAFTFLFINGLRLNAGADKTWRFLHGHYEKGTLSFKVLEKWIRDNTEEIR